MSLRAAGGRAFLRRYKVRRWRTNAGIFLLAGTPYLLFFLHMATGLSWRSVQLGRWIVLCVGIVLLAFTLRLLHWRMERRLRARLREHGYRICTQCGYTLNPEHDGHPCPECGTPVDLADFEHAWRKFAWRGLEPLEPPRRH
jgi:hypothetical protein